MLHVDDAVTEMDYGFMSAEGTGSSLFGDVCKRNFIVKWKIRLVTNKMRNM